jgi:pimeloyl-ACP methyl ester carboxylesterase/FixJ family two-component response regulator
VLQRLLDNPDRFLDEVRSDSEGFADSTLREEAEPISPSGAIPSLASIALIVFNSDSTVIALSRPEGWPSDFAFEELFNQLPSPKEPSRILFLRAREGIGLRAVSAGTGEAVNWNLPYTIRQALTANVDSRLLVCANAVVGKKGLTESVKAFGLTGLQQRVVMAVAKTGSARAAADELDFSYITVRESLSGAAKLMRAPNLPAVIRRVVEHSFGVLPSFFGTADEMVDWLPLSERQCQICELVTEGLSRSATAIALRISPAVVKKELEFILPALEVGSAPALARVWVEAKVLRYFARTTDGRLGFYDPSVEPTRFLPREDDRQVIAWSDYGPASGKPVLIVHSNWTCRSVPQKMVMQLQAAGWRPIAIDRPGFGSTHPGSLSQIDPFSQAIADTQSVLDRLRIGKIAVIARRAGHFTTVLKQTLGERIGPIILTSPSPPTADTGRRKGVVGVIKEAFFRSPQLIEFYFRVVTPQLSLERMEKLSHAIAEGSPPDQKLCDDPQFIRDRFRAIRPFSTGNFKGAVIEEMQVSRDLFNLTPLLAYNTMILHGLHDNHYSFEEVVRYWSKIWPGTEIRSLEDGGQFLTSSHPALLVDLLDELANRSEK